MGQLQKFHERGMENLRKTNSDQQYGELTDEQLIGRLRDGDAGVMDYLLEKYKFLVRRKSNPLFLLGGDADDLIQEGMIGLFKAIRDYDSALGNFYSFAELCITRQLYRAIEAASRKKHGPLNSYISLSGGSEVHEEAPIAASQRVKTDDPEQIVIDRETVDALLKQLYARLSKLEQQVLELYLDGLNYRQIAAELKKSEKSIDNALQRIKSKLQKLQP